MRPSHPHILLTDDDAGGLPTIAALRAAIGRPGPRRRLWQTILAEAETVLHAAPITPYDPMPGRAAEDVRRGNRDYVIVNAAGQRIVGAALAALLTEDRRYVDCALRQMACLFDATKWEEWQDIFHRQRFDLDADLRTGQLSRDLSLAWDWMYPMLSGDERDWVVRGIDRCGIQPYLLAVAADAWWLQAMNNWTTVIVGGLGMGGMALGTDHPQSAQLVELSRDVMLAYMDHYGPEGEFNENPSYANSSFLPVLYFSALRFHDGERNMPAPIAALRQHAYWCLYATAPPGQLVSFGDGGPAYPALTSFVPAVAAATADPVLQWFYLQHCEPPRFPVWELLGLDGDLQPEAPTPASLPLGRAYDAHSALISSRTSWDPRTTACVVFSKAGHGGIHHTHPDAGQIEIHGHAQRLIVDLGSVPYPAEQHHQYYHFSSAGHNQLTIGGRGQIWQRDGSRRARRTAAAFDNDRGAWWRIDLTALHENAAEVTRTVVHLHPGIVVVVDRARLQVAESCRLRWHPATEPEWAGPGSFAVVHGAARVDAWIGGADGRPLPLVGGRHQYQAPFDRDRMDNPLPQRREPYVDAVMDGLQICFVSLFAVTPTAAAAAGGAWERRQDRWVWGDVWVAITADELHVTGSAISWTVPLTNSDPRLSDIDEVP